MSSLYGIKSGAKSESTYLFQDASTWNPWTVDINIEDKDLFNAHTIPELKNPEFMCGTIKKEKSTEINDATEKSRQFQKMCEIWSKFAERKLQSQAREKSFLNRILQKEIENALDWLKKELDVAIRDSKGSGRSESKMLGQIPTADDRQVGVIEAKNNSMWKSIWNCICCISAKTSEFPNHDSRAQISVYIKFLSGSILIVNQQLDGDIADVKKKIHASKHIPPELQILFLDGKELKDETRLNSLDGLSNSTITLIQRRCTLGIPEDVAIHTVSNGTDIKFSSEHFTCLYKWYLDGQAEPDIYRGEYCYGATGIVRTFLVIYSNLLLFGAWHTGHTQIVGETAYGDTSYYRGQWLRDEYHGFGAEWRRSGEMYCGQWSHNAQSGFGLHVSTQCSPSPYNPHARQTLYLGTFRNGCPVTGLLIECDDYTTLTLGDFEPIHVDQKESVYSVGGKIDWKRLVERKVRTYEVEYDGRSAFWQAPVPMKKTGFFNFRTRLCEYAVTKCVGKLTDPKSLEAMWYSWIPYNDAKTTPNVVESGPARAEDQAHKLENDRPLLASKATEPEVTKERVFESFLFLGTSVRNEEGQFPCPLCGKQKLLPSSETDCFDRNDEFDVEYKGKTWIADSPAPSILKAQREYPIHKRDGDYNADNSDEDEKQIQEIANALSNDLLLAGKITSVVFKGDFVPHYFPLHGLLHRHNEVYQSKEVPLSKTRSGDAQIDDLTLSVTKIDDDDWSNMTNYSIDFNHWLNDGISERKIHHLCKPVDEPNPRKNQLPCVRGGLEAMMQAAKAQAFDLWSRNGALSQERKLHPLTPLLLLSEAFMEDATSYSWNRKIYCPHRGLVELIVADDTQHSKGRADVKVGNRPVQTFQINSVDLDGCVLLPGSKEWFKYVLMKVKKNFKANLERMKCKEDLILTKADFTRAKKFAFERRKAYDSPLESIPSTMNIQGDSHGCPHYLTFLPEICSASTSHLCEGKSDKTMTLENALVKEKLRKKAFATYSNAKRLLALAACKVVDKEIGVAREYEILTTINLSENNTNFFKLKNKIASGITLLRNSIQEMGTIIKEAKKRVENLRKEVENLEQKYKLSEKEISNPAQEIVRDKRIEMETARLNPNVARSKINAAKFTLHLFETVASYEKAKALHSKLMIAKSEARVRTRISHLHAHKVISTCRSKDNNNLLHLNFNEVEESVELEAVMEPTSEDLERKIQSLAESGSDPECLASLIEAKKTIEEKIDTAELSSADLFAEIQIATARVEWECAERVVWEEWVESAQAEEKVRPAQHSRSMLYTKLASLDTVSKRLEKIVAEANQQAKSKRRRRLPAYCGEGPRATNLAHVPWVPSEQVADYSECASRLICPAERALAWASTVLEGPLEPLTDNVKAEVEHLEKRLDEITRLAELFEAKSTNSVPKRDRRPG